MSRIILVNRSGLSYDRGQYDRIVLNVKDYTDLFLEQNHSSGSEIFDIRVNNLDDIKFIENIYSNKITAIHVPYNLKYFPSNIKFDGSVNYICDDIIADLDTPLDILENQITETIQRGYDSVIIEIYSDQISPLDSLADSKKFVGELTESDISSLIKRFPVSIGLANTSVLDLNRLPIELSTDTLYLLT